MSVLFTERHQTPPRLPRLVCLHHCRCPEHYLYGHLAILIGCSILPNALLDMLIFTLPRLTSGICKNVESRSEILLTFAIYISEVQTEKLSPSLYHACRTPEARYLNSWLTSFQNVEVMYCKFCWKSLLPSEGMTIKLNYLSWCNSSPRGHEIKCFTNQVKQ